MQRTNLSVEVAEEPFSGDLSPKRGNKSGCLAESCSESLRGLSLHFQDKQDDITSRYVQGLQVNHHTNRERVRFQCNMPPQGTHDSQHGVSRDATIITEIMGSESLDSESDERSITEDFDCDKVPKNYSRQDLIQWIKALQRWVRTMENSADRKASDMPDAVQEG